MNAAQAEHRRRLKSQIRRSNQTKIDAAEQESVLKNHPMLEAAYRNDNAQIRAAAGTSMEAILRKNRMTRAGMVAGRGRNNRMW